jgi:hypothetical protein
MNYYLLADKLCKLSKLIYSENRYINEPSNLGKKFYIFNHKFGVKNYLRLIISVHLLLLIKEVSSFCLPVLKIYFVYLNQSRYTTHVNKVRVTRSAYQNSRHNLFPVTTYFLQYVS